MVTPTGNNRYVEPDMAEFISRRMRDVSAQLNCMLIGTVISFDPENQTVKASVNFQRTLYGVNPLNNIAGASNQIVDYPTLINVPVIFLQGGVSYLTFPIAPGDTCLVFFCDRDMDIWLETGQIVPPNSSRVHSINDAVALVGIRNFQKSLADYNANIASLVDRTGERLAQSGDLKATARATAPSGWLLCYGQSISKTTYLDLFAAIGYTYGGSGDNFNVPDMRGRVPVGLDNMGGTNANVLTAAFNPNRDTLGGAIGEEAHLLTGEESGIQQHRHEIEVVNISTGNGGRIPWDDQTSIQGSDYTLNTGHTNALAEHQNTQPGRMFNWVIKL